MRTLMDCEVANKVKNKKNKAKQTNKLRSFTYHSAYSGYYPIHSPKDPLEKAPDRHCYPFPAKVIY